ncbi:F-box protein At5g18160-like [Lolium perenne]|uniref:F-box protein At5g18160-like n=1 Tax=Lolium perenne TaxID=4522 RepID=UPI003A99198D
MPDRRGATLLEDLPEEIIDNILVRLTSKDVGRCRAVSTSWRSATSTPEFMLQHHRRQPSLPLIYGREMLVAFGAGALWPFLPDTKHSDEIRIRGACDGLLAISWRSRSYVCNPVIRARVLLPQPQPCQDVAMGFAGKHIHNVIIGFYRHHPTGEHRVLWVVSRHYDEYSLYILTVGCDTPRHVEIRLPTMPEPGTMEHKLLAVLCGSNHCPCLGDAGLRG